MLNCDSGRHELGGMTVIFIITPVVNLPFDRWSSSLLSAAAAKGQVESYPDKKA